MPSDSIEIEFAGARLILLADRAVFWEARQTLLLADVHLGKDASFRMAGLPVPAGNTAKDLARIDALLERTAAKRLVVLGDLVHNRRSHQAELAEVFGAWRARWRDLALALVRGNHDKHAGPTPAGWGIEEVDGMWMEGPLTFAHAPAECDGALVCGHVHPVARVRDFDRSRVSVPCFVVEERQMILPSFGSFTGGCRMECEVGRRMYGAMGNSVVEIR